MPTVAIITNKNKDTDGKITKRVADILSAKYSVIFDSDYKDNIHKLYENSDVIVVMGGDGTLLSAATYASEYSLPVLGINLGNLGFMADVELESVEDSLKLFIDGKYKIEKRFMIDAVITKANGENKKINALNDVVVTRASYQRMVAFDVYVNGDHLSLYQGDGLVVSTPTGSTAYSMSAGGPIVDPSLDVCIITPVCAHTMSSKPVIVPGNANIEIHFRSTFNDMAMMTADGKEGIRLSEGDVINIKGSPNTVGLIKISDKSFYEILRRKLQP